MRSVIQKAAPNKVKHHNLVEVDNIILYLFVFNKGHLYMCLTKSDKLISHGISLPFYMYPLNATKKA